MTYMVCSCNRILVEGEWKSLDVQLLEEIRQHNCKPLVEGSCSYCLDEEAEYVTLETEMGKGIV
jgi:hypothetical protein